MAQVVALVFVIDYPQKVYIYQCVLGGIYYAIMYFPSVCIAT